MSFIGVYVLACLDRCWLPQLEVIEVFTDSPTFSVCPVGFGFLVEQSEARRVASIFRQAVTLIAIFLHRLEFHPKSRTTIESYPSFYD